jgi:hypothetical protein
MNKQTQEALKLAIEALEFEGSIKDALKACKKALEQSEKQLSDGDIKHTFVNQTGYYMDEALLPFVRACIEQAQGIGDETE